MAARRKDSVANVISMSVPERILAVEEIWDSIAKDPADLRLTPSQQKELDRRLKRYSQEPAVGSSWIEARRRIRNSSK